ncbi:MAG: translation initiation factor IF-3 [Zetaproteobacteria bacterium CG12_big_fil_rev_8_21_14_0_65_54_13]|nr:MAG: translation initiation factor IF-3 [Zetaproteobacteria bacterium CG23_combo_of_CG06-09_8_20_14_all_54_7]PIW48141.1 MAG: translation initiation factor IF-3 [Zetaproteobacteria bacterium CG12_big_fil_rev_8_21_14_0_65_54_13]PIX55223.1 MAG: translation initiation factor IF-3 [Zetaproteobacteria bacterium CG_4_10_14_3_um_filter_54_28]PJA28106.1 MAG: translation initiation factor IF-3 [Zetaproteobacteria bacterium CG_4_9_14_3_um_filter_54_145]
MLSKGARIKKDLPINFEINADSVRVVVDTTGEQLGVLSLREAVAAAEANGLDLVLMAAKSNPPVCRIMDYGKYKYEQSKKANAAKKRQHVMQIKEVKVRASTDKHDLDVKLKRSIQFLSEGNKVKVTLRFRGREMAHTEQGLAQMKHVAEQVAEYGKPEKMPNMEGRQMIMVLAPLKK